MAESVVLKVEQMVHELSELKEKELLSEAELIEIVNKRREFEYKFLSNYSKQETFINSLKFELKLLRLLKLRRGSKGIKKETKAEYSVKKRIHYEFQRLLKSRRGDVKLWMAYADFCSRSKSYRVLNRLFSSSLKMNPTSGLLWLSAAQYHVNEGSYASARSMLHIGLRFLPGSVDMWREYFRFELLAAMASYETEGKLQVPETVVKHAFLGPCVPNLLLADLSRILKYEKLDSQFREEMTKIVLKYGLERIRTVENPQIRAEGYYAAAKMELDTIEDSHETKMTILSSKLLELCELDDKNIFMICKLMQHLYQRIEQHPSEGFPGVIEEYQTFIHGVTDLYRSTYEKIREMDLHHLNSSEQEVVSDTISCYITFLLSSHNLNTHENALESVIEQCQEIARAIMTSPVWVAVLVGINRLHLFGLVDEAFVEKVHAEAAEVACNPQLFRGPDAHNRWKLVFILSIRVLMKENISEKLLSNDVCKFASPTSLLRYILISRGIEEARIYYESRMDLLSNFDFCMQVIDCETSQFTRDETRITNLFEKALLLSEISENQEMWKRYATFVKFSSTSERLPTILWRAQKALNTYKVEYFM